MATLLDAHDLARNLIAEWQTPPEVFTDARLLEFSPEVYKDIQRRFAAAGHPRLKVYDLFDIAAGVTSATSGDASFPTDMIKPFVLWEAAQGSLSLSAFSQMEEAWPYLIPRAALATLIHWEWKNNTIYFVGASATRTVRMLYAKYLPELTAVGNTLLIDDVVGALAQGISAAAAFARGSTRAEGLKTDFENTVASLIAVDGSRMGGA